MDPAVEREFTDFAAQRTHALLRIAYTLTGDQQGGPVQTVDGSAIFGEGLPADLYRTVMASTHTAMGLPNIPFPEPAFAGEVNPRGSVPG